MSSRSYSNVKRIPRMVGDVTKPSGEGNDKEAKHPHDDDQQVSALDSKVEALVVRSQKKQRRQYTKNDPSEEESNKEAKHPHVADRTVAALDNKVDAVVVGSHKRKRRQYTENERVTLVALIREALDKSVGNKKVTKQIILNHGITPSVYYKWTTECALCAGRIKSLSIHCVACSTKTCHVRLCYACFGKHFICLLSITPAFLQVYAIDCGWCRIKDSVVVHKFGEHQPTRTFNKDLFHQELLREINQGVKECEQLLGKLTRDLAGFRHNLIEVLDSVTEASRINAMSVTRSFLVYCLLFFLCDPTTTASTLL